MKKILLINTLYYPYIGGGAEIIFQQQVEGLKKRGYDVAVLTTGKNENLIKEYINGIKIYRAGIKNFYWHYGNNKSNNKLIKLLWHLRDSYNIEMKKYINVIIDMENPDLIICHNLAGFSISIWDEIKKRNVKVIQVLHDLYLLCANSTMFRKEHTCKKQCTICRTLRRIHKYKSEKVDVLVGVSKFVIQKMSNYNYFTTVRKQIIYNAQNINYVDKVKIWDGKDIFKIGYIGSLTQSKGIEWLITQFNKLNINAKLLIAGKGELNYEKYLKQLSNDKIEFLGYTDSSEFYKNVHIICLPSICEDNLPGVAYEASANNIPVIASLRGGIPEIIIDMVNGLLIDPEQEDSLGKAILKLYNDKKLFKKLSQQGRNSVEAFLNVDKMLDKYESIIENL